MNDFTKDELRNISDAILYSELMESRKDSLIPIRDKIQSMIDNYCEHESDYKIGDIIHAADDSESSVLIELACKKCGKFYK